MISCRLALATYRGMPRLALADHDLCRELMSYGIHATPLLWDADVDWSSFDAVLVRATWDYVPRRDEFLTWARQAPHVMNPAAVLTWNTDKHYLEDLAAAGIPVTPTCYLAPGEPLHHPFTGDIVIKPAIGAWSVDTGRFAPDDPAAAALATRIGNSGRDVLIQPYEPGIETTGETALFFYNGQFSHAVRKSPLLPRRGERNPMSGAAPAVVTRRTPTPADLAAAQAALRAVPEHLPAPLYARVDLIPDAAGVPHVLELELTEPNMFFDVVPEAVPTFALHIAKYLADAGVLR